MESFYAVILLAISYLFVELQIFFVNEIEKREKIVVEFPTPANTGSGNISRNNN